MEGYSLDRLRELVLVELETGHARDGSHLYESLDTLFELVNNGYHATRPSRLSRSTMVPTICAVRRSTSSSRASTLPSSSRRDCADQRRHPSQRTAPAGTEEADVGRRQGPEGFGQVHLHAQLGINQIGAVYEGLMAYSGFYADEDLCEVAKNSDPDGGTWMLAVDQADEYPEDVFVTRTDPVTGAEERVLHEKGSFVYRLSGRDRQRSANYYTPEVLTVCREACPCRAVRNGRLRPGARQLRHHLGGRHLGSDDL